MLALGLSGADEEIRTLDLLITNQHAASTCQVAEVGNSFRINPLIYFPSALPLNYTCKVLRCSTMTNETTCTKHAQSVFVSYGTVVVSFTLQAVALAVSLHCPIPDDSPLKRSTKPSSPWWRGKRNRANDDREFRGNLHTCIEGQHGPCSAAGEARRQRLFRLWGLGAHGTDSGTYWPGPPTNSDRRLGAVSVGEPDAQDLRGSHLSQWSPLCRNVCTHFRER